MIGSRPRWDLAFRPVGALEGALFSGRAALELSGVAEHCVEHFDFYETIRQGPQQGWSLAKMVGHSFAQTLRKYV